MSDVETQEAAWQRHALERERTGALIACALIVTLVPLWSLFDHWLEPAHARSFLVIRIGIAAVGAGAYHVIRRTTAMCTVRLAMLGAVLATGLGIAFFLTRIDDHYVLYTMGFSLVFWGFAPLVGWPWHLTAGSYVVILGVHLGHRALGSHEIASATQFYGLLAYLSSAAAVSVGVALVLRRLEREAFVARYALERKNRELAAALATLRDAQERFVATEKLSALGRLIAQLSHEINNPVNVLQNNLGPVAEYLADLEQVLDLARRLDGSGELEARWRELDIDFVRTDTKEAIAIMVTAAERIRTIQSDLRTFMRGDSAPLAEADLNAGVRSTVAMLRRNLPPNAELVERYGDLPLARFHAGQLNQVTMNLLQNALDAVASGGRVEIETRRDGDELVLAIADTGPGVPEAVRRQLFEPFFTTKEVGKGTGLGLATCYQIVEAHGGSIALDEAHAPGARFVVRLPIHGGGTGRDGERGGSGDRR